MKHAYVSTACQHEQHSRCRAVCKFCDRPCLCDCHGSAVRASTSPSTGSVAIGHGATSAYQATAVGASGWAYTVGADGSFTVTRGRTSELDP